MRSCTLYASPLWLAPTAFAQIVVRACHGMIQDTRRATSPHLATPSGALRGAAPASRGATKEHGRDVQRAAPAAERRESRWLRRALVGAGVRVEDASSGGE